MEEKGRIWPWGVRQKKAQGGQTTRQKQRPRQSQQLPDHMIADRCQGRRRKVACRSGRAQDKVRMSKEKERKRGQRKNTAQRENMKHPEDSRQKEKRKKKIERKKRAESTVSEERQTERGQSSAQVQSHSEEGLHSASLHGNVNTYRYACIYSAAADDNINISFD